MVSNDTWHTEFAYDGLSCRIETREYTNGALTSVKRHMYDGWLPVAELNETNGLVSAMTWGLDLSLTFEGAGGIGGLLSLTQHSTPDTLFYFYDGNGNVVDVLDDADILAAHYEYDPFGNRLVADGTHADQPFQWSTKMRHEPSGLVYYGYRFLKPDIGRWLNRDPIGERFEHNVYLFVANNSTHNIDYLGLLLTCPSCCTLDRTIDILDYDDWFPVDPPEWLPGPCGPPYLRTQLDGLYECRMCPAKWKEIRIAGYNVWVQDVCVGDCPQCGDYDYYVIPGPQVPLDERENGGDREKCTLIEGVA